MEQVDITNMESSYSGPSTELLLYTYPVVFTEPENKKSLIIFQWDSCIYIAELAFGIKEAKAYETCPKGIEPTEVSCAFQITTVDDKEVTIVLSDDGYYCDSVYFAYDITSDFQEVYDSYDFDVDYDQLKLMIFC